MGRIARQVLKLIGEGKTLAEIIEADVAARSTIFKVAKAAGVNFKRLAKRRNCPHCGREIE